MGKEVNHHWQGLNPDTDKYKGFLYEITNNLNGMKYIGRKLMWREGKKKLKRTGKKPKLMYKWHYYTGSSDRLNRDIEEFGKENFTFRIIRLYKTKSGLRYGEVTEIVKRKALTVNRELYYNGSIDKCYSPTEWYEGKKRVDRPKGKKG